MNKKNKVNEREQEVTITIVYLLLLLIRYFQVCIVDMYLLDNIVMFSI